MTETARRLLRELALAKKKHGIHPCCAWLITGPHSSECPNRRTKCSRCEHSSHVGGVCGFIITETINDDVGFFHTPSYEEITLIKSLCRCVTVGLVR